MTDKHDPMAELDAAIEKAKGRFPSAVEKALRINGGVRVSPAQRRAIAMGRRKRFNVERTKRMGTAQYGGSSRKPSSNPGARGPRHIINPEQGRSRRRVFANLKTGKYKWPGGQKRSTLNRTRQSIGAMYERTGRKSPYKRTLMGNLKRVRKGDDAIHKAKPKTLYVYRPVENAEDIIAWAKSQGFTSTQPAEKFHVTLAYSKTPLNWAHLHDDYHLEPSEYARSCGCEVVSRSDDNSKRRKISGGVREVKALGSDGAVVLAFESDSLTNRWMDFKRAGAVWKFPSFTPHITITYDGGKVDLSKVHPYAGDIILGEECWEEVSENGQANAIAAEKKVTKALEAIDQRLAAVEKAVTKPDTEAA